VISFAVNRRRESHGGRAHTESAEGERRLLGGEPGRRRRAGIPRVLLGPDHAGGEAGRSGGDDERSIRTRQCLAECLDGAQVRIGSALKIPRESDVVLVRGVNDPVARGSAGAQAVEVIQSAAMHIGAGGGEGFSRGIRTGEPEDLMACADELRNGGGANPAGRAGDENTHEKTSMGSAVLATGRARAGMSVAVMSVAVLCQPLPSTTIEV